MPKIEKVSIWGKSFPDSLTFFVVIIFQEMVGLLPSKKQLLLESLVQNFNDTTSSRSISESLEQCKNENRPIFPTPQKLKAILKCTYCKIDDEQYIDFAEAFCQSPEVTGACQGPIQMSF